jgi:hypothetical protein
MEDIMEQPYDKHIDAEAMAALRQSVFEHTVRTDAMWAIYATRMHAPVSWHPAFVQRVLATLERTIIETQVFFRAYAYYLERCAALGLTVAEADGLWEQYAPPQFDQTLLQVSYEGGSYESLIDTRILSQTEQPRA